MRYEKLSLLRSTRRSQALTATESALSDALYEEYCSRPQHASRLTRSLKASLRAAANSVARHGLPPNRNQRLAYRRWKKQRARELAIAIYGDPNALSTQELIYRELGRFPKP
jgi:hypothetical protein